MCNQYFRFIKLTLTIYLLLLCNLCSSQVIVDYVNVEQDQGLHQRQVNKVVRDHAGYFYFFMPDAIQRYDGSDFELINTSALAAHKLTPKDIDRVAVLEDGTVSMSVDRVNQHFLLLPHTRAVIASPSPHTIIVSAGQLYAVSEEPSGSHNLMLAACEAELINIVAEVSALPAIPRELYLTANGGIYFSTAAGDVYRKLEPKANFELLQYNGRLAMNSNKIYLWTSTQILDITTGDRTVATLTTANMWLTQLKVDKMGNMTASYSAKDRFNNAIYKLTPDEKLTSLDALVDVGSKLFIDYWTDDASYKWMLVGYNAIKVVSTLRDGAYIHHKNPAAKKGEFGNVMSGVACDFKGHTYYLREQRGFHQIVGDAKHRDAMPNTLFQNTFYNNGKLYHSRYDDKLYSYGYRYDGTSEVFKSDVFRQQHSATTVPFKINDIYPADDQILVGGYDNLSKKGKLAWLNMATGVITDISVQMAMVRSIYFNEATQEYWIGTTKGIHVLNTELQEVAVLSNRSDEGGNQYLPNEYVVMITPYADKMVAGSLGGIYIIDSQTHAVEKHISESNGLSNGQAIGIIPDDLGYCWITTFNGVNIMDSTYHIVRQLYDHQGLSDREFNSKAIAKTTNGRIYGGTLNGITGFAPELVMQWSEPYGLDISSITAHEAGSSRSLPITEASFYSSVDSIVVQYATPDYYNYPFTRDDTQAHLAAGNAELSHTGKQIVLKNIKSGDLTLAFANDITNRGLTVHMHAKTDYRWLMALAALLLLLGLIGLSVVRYNKKKAYEWSRLQGKVAELQLTSLQAQMNPHFIFNALGAVQYFIQTHDAEKADEYLSNFAMLMRRILESSKSKYISIKNEIELQELYIGLEAIRFENKFDYEVNIDDNLDTDMNVPPMIIQPYVENAINHGLYNLTDRKGRLILDFRQIDEDTICCTVTDNGVGRKKALELRTKRHKSRGMQIVKERIDTINTAGEMQVKIEIKDLTEGGSASGTKAIITVKDIP